MIFFALERSTSPIVSLGLDWLFVLCIIIRICFTTLSINFKNLGSSVTHIASKPNNLCLNYIFLNLHFTITALFDCRKILTARHISSLCWTLCADTSRKLRNIRRISNSCHKRNLWLTIILADGIITGIKEIFENFHTKPYAQSLSKSKTGMTSSLARLLWLSMSLSLS